ncbi:MAG TPA: hypothetical protein VII62_02175, partial [Vicinamibacteria bacterium]
MAERARPTGEKSRRRFLRRLGASVAASLVAPGAVAAQARKKAAPRQRPSKPKAPAAPAKSAAPRPAPAPPP